MRLRTRAFTLVFQSLALLLTLSVYQMQAAAAPVINGSYKVVDTTDLGTDVRVTLNIRLTNPGDAELFVTQASLRGVPPFEQSGEAAVSVILDAHGSSRFTQQFTIPKTEYDLLHKGVRLYVSLKVQAAGGDETIVTVVLMRRPGGGSQ